VSNLLSNHGASCPSACAIGRTNDDQWEVVLIFNQPSVRSDGVHSNQDGH
jgi:hypothetical protein